eukprot:COSAG06_NODE_291_length_18216_cov_13.929514_5_plen_215_part_00
MTHTVTVWNAICSVRPGTRPAAIAPIGAQHSAGTPSTSARWKSAQPSPKNLNELLSVMPARVQRLSAPACRGETPTLGSPGTRTWAAPQPSQPVTPPAAAPSANECGRLATSAAVVLVLVALVLLQLLLVHVLLVLLLALPVGFLALVPPPLAPVLLHRRRPAVARLVEVFSGLRLTAAQDDLRSAMLLPPLDGSATATTEAQLQRSPGLPSST